MDREAHRAIKDFLIMAVVMGAAVLSIAFLPPLVQGYHVGCNAWNGDNLSMTRLGVQFCKSAPPAQAASSPSPPSAPSSPSPSSAPQAPPPLCSAPVTATNLAGERPC